MVRMAVVLDPEGEELRALAAFVEASSGLQVLEVGCGDGRLTRRYAAQVARVTAIDPDGDDILHAQDKPPDALRDRGELQAVGIGEYRLSSGAPSFDLVLLAWSL